ncbi:Panacea domain-containing protein [Mesorhizobium australafricanum]|uniref:Panacea domain-containing protein n=1 Tax=Mesorhizobium australafricanum TaxID=3072311 RepID=UPI003D322A1D
MPITHLSLQKLLYFSHGRYLISNRIPLIKEHFEAWQYGPVLPSVYRALKHTGSSELTERIDTRDILSGVRTIMPSINNSEADDVLVAILLSYGRKSTRFLVQLSHAAGAPWKITVDKSRTNGSLGLKISNQIIVEAFKYHKIAVTSSDRGDSNDCRYENEPVAGYRPG